MEYDAPTYKSPSKVPMENDAPTYKSPSKVPMEYDAPTYKSPSKVPMEYDAPTYKSPSKVPMEYDAPTYKSPSKVPMEYDAPTYKSPSKVPMEYDAPTYKSPSNVPMEFDAPTYFPTFFDWSKEIGRHIVTPVKDQGMCKSGWAFSTIANIESHMALNNDELLTLSEQNLIDCDHQCTVNKEICNSGCEGGLTTNGFDYALIRGINLEKDYSYNGFNAKCRQKLSSKNVKISNWTTISDNEDYMAQFLFKNGPLSVAVEASMWQFYGGGVLNLPCGNSLDHAVLLTGFGIEAESSMPYWIAKNSWGEDWGMSGYIHIERGVGRCGINRYVTTVI